MPAKTLSKKEIDVLSLLAAGWQGYEYFHEIIINGKKAADLQTMKSLERKGCVSSYKTYGEITVWKATSEGVSLHKEVSTIREQK